MAWTMGIFEREQQVLDAARRLREAGLGDSRLRVIVKNEESAPLLSSQDAVPVEGIAGVRETRERQEREGHEWDGDGEAVVPAVAYLGTLQGFGTAGNTAPVAAYALSNVGDDDLEAANVLRGMGVPDSAADACADALRGGKFVLTAEEDGEAAQAGELMRATGAVDVLH
ncbi:hypothetical protein J19TS2_08350 [Cohnella xylanilytica]|uniref:Heat induced stress protein YflT n=1 Tax=Cohnella xylanilytica TaxID=557555 RepID=A0A841TYQ1_9BACL|nr:hypothetical protein [Cohnella xylanilytica]MBB6692098.1 hypothetical protein [Cohnella xylanilytica]GIO11280.1 hypothetical protein J19TS2_08350 [Cohnella xylanilytica]